MRRVAIALAVSLVACGGATPLLHGAHVLRPGFVEVGAGVAGEVGLRPLAETGQAGALQELAVSPGVSPWVGARVGFAGDNEAGLAYTGRSVRLEGRHAFTLNNAMALSVGGGLSAIIAHELGHALDASSVYGAGFDVPVLLGLRSANGIYELWIGPRGGLELMRGQLGTADIGQTDETIEPAKAAHVFAGGLVGLRTGFRHVHVAIEGSFLYHHAAGTLGDTHMSLSQLSITPGAALQIEF
jgi:hypothetical protein